MRKHLNSQVVKVATLTFDEKSKVGRFEGFEGDFDAISISANIVAEIRGHRKPQTTITVESLIDPALADQEELKIELTRKSVERFDMEDPAEIQEQRHYRPLRISRAQTFQKTAGSTHS